VDTKLLAWGRAAASFGEGNASPAAPSVARSQLSGRCRHPSASAGNLTQHGAACWIPPLWLFTDSRRLPDPRAAVAKLPRGLAGVVFRHDDDPNRAALGRDLARICRARRLLLVVAGDVRLAAALRAGVHLRGGHWPAPFRTRGFVTSSAHGFPDLRRAARTGASLAFLSPVFATASHPEVRTFGPARWSGLARHAPIAVAGLGGIDGRSIRRLPRTLCRAAGAIGALA
jgi:thiamine-phosphate pyrophosphorylase